MAVARLGRRRDSVDLKAVVDLDNQFLVAAFCSLDPAVAVCDLQVDVVVAVIQTRKLACDLRA